MKIKKRFIAAAKCDHCHAQDTLRWWIENNIEHVECVECDFFEQRKPSSVKENSHSDQDMIGIFKPE
ncbi:YheV family putative metal-binding protein [Vibrio profundum]|uniref:YheV family putative zinc ribbon protein n=1 Tax=Vibrio profundum TaxID=2910247 RepID=UPI003D1202A1